MLHDTPRIRFIPFLMPGLIAGALLLAGCAQSRPDGFYEKPRESSLSDAQNQAQGRRGTRAPSQLQVGFGQTQEEREAQAQEQEEETQLLASNPRNLARPLRQARTFLGTLPCPDNAYCAAQRITLTFAPSGEWRARTEELEGSKTPITQRGCWAITGNSPLRIMLQTQNKDPLADFVFENDTTMRVSSYLGKRPALSSHLTRQSDIDPIDEIQEASPLNCNEH